uniref:Minor capsid protein P9 transmembrane helices domain-containing protein n=1 Tax=viral metagenome TaxID=1070528 RepID=A0A6C0AJP9_9ZZZZ
MSGRELFWLNDPANLFKRWTRFVPTNDMTVPEALNAVVRFTIYSSLLISLITQKSWYLLLIPTVMVVSAILVRMYPETQVLKETFGSGSSLGAATPKASNPFMNVLFTDYVDSPDRPAAPSNINQGQIKASIDEAFSKTSDLYMDTSDKYGLMQSARQWVTQASTTIPNDLEGYQKFLNQDNVSRKELSESYVVAKGSTNSPKGLL